ncbi:hypothetical protein PQU92_16785 [Asticcacaulis sp. BYS171W]|uniref:Transmembrane protein n=1 Tax=Asticcacaulis aquaticus TaxID=2984212 RepID=A0ABT5HXY4_9CAUL|nr:hypothetical protein [Asticcacaulis aquaticus]MDC7684942.1 hypothetical protein [Asticcacaulis aquaticus]
MTNSDRDALDALRAGRMAAVAGVNRYGWSYDLIYAVLVGSLIVVQVLPLVMRMPLMGGLLVLLAAVFVKWTRITGVRITGFSPRRARWVAVGLGAVITPLVLFVLWIGYKGGPAWVAPVAGLVGFAVALTGSRLWRRVYRAEMEALL